MARGKRSRAGRSLVDEPDEETNDEELHDDENILDHEEGSGSGNKAKTRGPSMGADLWLWKGPPMHVKYNERGAAVDGHCSELSMFIGCLSRHGEYFSICEPSWKHVKAEKKDKAWDEITKRFEVPDPGKTRPIIMTIINNRWKQWKSDLKKSYFVEGDRAQSIKNIEEETRVQPDQWAVLVTFWLTEQAKKESKQNQENRKKTKSCHALGTKSLEKMQYQWTRKTGEVLDRANSYILSQTRKDGSILESATSNVEKIKKKQEAIFAEGNGDVQTTGRNDVYEQALGKDPRGRVRHVGPGATATKLWGRKQVDYTHVQQENESLREEVALSKERVEAAEDKAKEAEAKAAAAEEKATEADNRAATAETKADAVAKECEEIRGLISRYIRGA